MKENIQKLADIYKSLTNKWEEVVFVDFLSDLRKWILDPSKAWKTNHLSPYIDESIEEIREWFKDPKLQKFFGEMRNILLKDGLPQDGDSWIFILNKERQFFSKEVKKEFVILEKNELGNIYDFRRILLQNFCNHKLVQIYEAKNERLQKFYSEYLDEISEENEKNRRVLTSIENIENKDIRAYFKRIQTDFWAERFQEVFERYINDIELINYFCNKEDVEELYSLVTWKEEEKKYVEFFPSEGILKYEWKKSKPFKKGDNPYKMLCYIFGQDKDIGIDKQEIYFAMEDTNSTELFYENIDKINATKNAINRRFRDDFQTKEKFLVFDRGLLYRKK